MHVITQCLLCRALGSSLRLCGQGTVSALGALCGTFFLLSTPPPLPSPREFLFILPPPPQPSRGSVGGAVRVLTDSSLLPLTVSDGGVPTALCGPVSHTVPPVAHSVWVNGHPILQGLQSQTLLSSQPFPNSILSANPVGSAFRHLESNPFLPVLPHNPVRAGTCCQGLKNGMKE